MSSSATGVQPAAAGKGRPKAAQPAPARIVIQYPSPSVDGGRYPAKRCVGDAVRVEADVFRDGHELLRAVIRHRAPGGRWAETEMVRIDAHLGGVRWAGSFRVERTGRYEYTVEAWTDVFGTWRDELRRKLEAGQHDLRGEIAEGIVLLRAAAESAQAEPDDSGAARSSSRTTRAPADPARQDAERPASASGGRAGGEPGTKALIDHALRALEDPAIPEAAKHDVALGPELFDAVERVQERRGLVKVEHPLAIEVDRTRARFAAWYELFPRSWGGLGGVERQLPRLAELGFDVLYLPPIHPIGRTNRKGRDNSLIAGPEDPGSPWAIGDESGGHDAVHPELGTLEDVRRLTRTAGEHGIDIALDYAIQASADHPWLTEHPEWFHRRPDGTLKYAENPPKRYQDIYNFNWDSPDWRGLWEALLEVVLQWVDCGVKVFRVDNPHTKPFLFWEWLIRQVHERDRDVVFLAEAFTRRAVMRHLAKIGFSQSYTYFTWKNGRHELSQYVLELAYSGEQEYFRPNFFVNTPDILHAYLQHGGRPAFEARLVLAATLSPTYGIYSGFENVENVPAREGSEEYLHSEKYQLKRRALNGELLPMIQQLNFVRRENPALQHLSNITFLDGANDALIAYAKQADGNTVIGVVNIDPHQPQEGAVTVPASLGLAPSFSAHDLLSDERYQWRIGPNYVRLEPGVRQAHVLRVEA